MCSLVAERIGITARGKGTADWITLTKAHVYHDHPLQLPLEHAIVIDLADGDPSPDRGRIAIEMSPEAAREFARAIERALAQAG